MMTAQIFKLSPSDLTFLWDECKRCFYLKVVRKFNRPPVPFPSIFTKIDGLMKAYYQGKPTSVLSPDLPPGTILQDAKWVQSQPIILPGHPAQCYLTGKYDSVVQFDDGSYGVIDFKTSTPRATHLDFYGRQLRAYAYALEHPAAGKFSLSPITRLGLLVVEPNAIDKIPSGEIAYLGKVTWQEIPVDEAAFLAFLGDVLTVLELTDPPEAAESCVWCQYRQAARENEI
jgi:hypothetical protein